MIKKLKKFVSDSSWRFGILNYLGLLKFLDDESYIKKEYYYKMGKILDLDNPQSFNEKLQWLKIHDRKEIYTFMVDKAAVKDYIGEMLGREYLIPTIGIWDNADDIDFSILPQQFVLKCTHNSGGVIICRNKSSFNIEDAKKSLNKSIKRNYYYEHREWVYKDVPHRIIAEKYMSNPGEKSLMDYKFYCFNGKPLFLYVSVGLENHKNAQISFFDMEWNVTVFGRSDYKPLKNIPPKPKNFNEMVSIAKRLSQNIPFVRVDLYEIRGKIFFSELTFCPCAGMMFFEPPEADLEIGKLLELR